MGIWAAVKYALNSTLGTSSFLSLDKMIQAHGTQTFTEDGTFTVPAGVTKILVTAFGAGGGGGRYDASGGQGGDRVIKKVYSVVSGTVIPITIGKGGAGAKASNGAKGNDGGATVIGNIVTLDGGGGGTSKSHRGSPGGSAAMNGMDSPMANGGLKGSDTYYSDNTYEVAEAAVQDLEEAETAAMRLRVTMQVTDGLAVSEPVVVQAASQETAANIMVTEGKAETVL